MRRLRILTPELVPLEYRLAGMSERGIAWVVDEIIVNTVLALLVFVLSLFSGLTAGIGAPVALAFFLVAYFALGILYRWIGEVRFRGLTIGKRLLRLRVVQENGTSVQSWQALVRNVVRVVDALPFFGYLLGASAMFLDGKSRRVGDLLAGTVVIHEVVHEPPRAVRVLARSDSSLSTDAGAVSRIRRRLTPREATLLTEFVAVAERIDTARRLELARRLAGSYRERLRLDAHAGLPDEALLRGIAGVVARDRFGTPGRVRARR